MHRPPPNIGLQRTARCGRAAAEAGALARPRNATAALVSVAFLSLACSSRITPSQAEGVLRRSGAFASPSSPRLLGITGIMRGIKGWTPRRRDSDNCIVGFQYEWPRASGVEAASHQTAPPLVAEVALSRTSDGWVVDVPTTRSVTPSWPNLPKGTP